MSEETVAWIVVGITVLLTAVILIVTIMLQFLQVEYNLGGRTLRATTGLRSYNLFLDGQLVDTQISWFSMGGVMLQHREDDLDILVRVTRGFWRPRVTCKVNGQVVTPKFSN